MSSTEWRGVISDELLPLPKLRGEDDSMNGFEIIGYEIKLGPELYGYFNPKVGDVELETEIEAGGIIRCLGKDKEILELYFLDADSPVPPHHIRVDEVTKKKVVALFLPYERISDYVDLLRNERPLKAVIEKLLERSYISTSWEKVGEGEGR